MSGSNRLPLLAEEIRSAHAGTIEAMTSAAEHACTAGRALIEAKSLLKHGEWLPWLRDNCRIPPRTAQLYMGIAKCIDELGLKNATVAHFGLRALGQIAAGERVTLPFTIDSFADCDEKGRQQWFLYALFTRWPLDRIEWLARRPFADPDEWLGEEGTKYRGRFGFREPTTKDKEEWRAFQYQHRELTEAEIISRLDDGAA